MSKKEKTCIFCEIINRKAPGDIVYEDEFVMAFIDTSPLNPGHILVVPKAHARDISEVDETTFTRMSAVARDLSKNMMNDDMGENNGLNLFMANGSSAGQHVMHAHLHLIPRVKEDGIRFGHIKGADKPATPALGAVVLRTDRLLLRPFTLSDAPDVQRLAGEKEIGSTSSIPHPYPDGVAEEWIKSHRKNLKEGKVVTFAIVKHDGNLLVGSIGLKMNLNLLKAELGCWIGKPYWKAGFATEATRAVIRYGFETLGLNRISGCHMTRNPASGRIFEKLGMKKEGVLRQEILKFGVYEDLAVYGLLRTEYADCRKF